MFNKKQVQESIKRIDNAVSQLNGNRQTHITLANDVTLVQKVCMDYFDERTAKKEIEESEDVRTDQSA